MAKHKKRVFVIIDGSNFYHRLKELKIKNQLQLDFTRFIKSLINNDKLVKSCYYVGAIRTEKGNRKSYKLFKNQIKLFGHLHKQNIQIYRGYILKTDAYHEKGVDVKIAIDILIGAYENLYDKVILLSSDTDLLPAIEKAVSLGKTIQYVGFSHNPSFALINHARPAKLLTADDILPFIKK